MSARKLVAKSILPDWSTTKEGAETAAKSWRKRYRQGAGYSVRVHHRKMTAEGIDFGFWLVLVTRPADSRDAP